MRKKTGRGSVSRSIRRLDRLETEKGLREKLQKINRKSQLKRKKKFNKRCIDCNKLIFPHATRCKSCHLNKSRH